MEKLMIINMLEAVSAMLEIPDTEKVLIGYEKVKCAKIMLDKIIEGMKKDKSLDNSYGKIVDVARLTPIEEAKPNPTSAKRMPKQDEVEIMVDAGIIQSIKNAKDDTMIELDGKALPWRKAIGMSFSKGKIL